MTDPASRAISTAAASAGCAAIAYFQPMVAGMSVAGIMLTTYFIWSKY